MPYAVTFREDGGVAVELMAGITRRAEDMRVVLDDFGDHMIQSSVPATFAAGGRPKSWARSAWSSEKNQVDSAALLRSVDYEVDGTTLRVGSNLAYARQRQLGGTITARGAKSLVVPLPGTPRNMRPKDWGDRLFKMPAKKGDPKSKGILAIHGPTGDVMPLYALRAKVTQPARPFVVYQPEDVEYVGRRLFTYLATGSLS